MSKRAEEAALKAYPPTYTTVKRHAKRVQSELVDTHQPARAIFQQGYEQAEKDLALTWEDASAIVEIAMDIIGEGKIHGEQNIYTEVLKRFNEQRKK